MFHNEHLRKSQRAQHSPCPCGALKENARDSYCRRCRAHYMREYRGKAPGRMLAMRYELERLRQELEVRNVKL